MKTELEGTPNYGVEFVGFDKFSLRSFWWLAEFDLRYFEEYAERMEHFLAQELAVNGG